jgi:hypothetical protein
MDEPDIQAAVRPQQYIRCSARGDRWRVARIVAARGLRFAFLKEIHDGAFVETIGRVELEYKGEVAAWFKDSAGRLDGALLAYSVTTDARELIRELEQHERIEAAKRVLAERAKRKETKRKAPAPDASSHATKLAADKAAERARSRRRARRNARIPIAGNTGLLPADETAVPLVTGPGSSGE